MKTLSPTVITLPWRPDAAEHYFAPVNHLPWAMLLHSGDAIHPYNRFDILVADPVTTSDQRSSASIRTIDITYSSFAFHLNGSRLPQCGAAVTSVTGVSLSTLT